MEEGLDAQVAEVEVNPFDGAKAQDDVELLEACVEVGDVVLVSETESRVQVLFGLHRNAVTHPLG